MLEKERKMKKQQKREEREQMESEAAAQEKLHNNASSSLLSKQDDKTQNDDDHMSEGKDEFDMDKLNSKLKKSNLNDDEDDDDNEEDEDEEDITEFEMNKLKVTGNFSLRMAHDWINACLPEVPPRIGKTGGGNGDDDEHEELFYTNSFTQSELSIHYSVGYLLIQSDSASSIAIMRDVIATKARDLRVDVDLDDINMNKLACTAMLEKIDPLLRYQLELASKVGLIDSLVEITVSEQAMNGCDDNSSISEKFPWLSQDLQDILKDSEKLQNEYKFKPRAL
jgi:hypothetical protein